MRLTLLVSTGILIGLSACQTSKQVSVLVYGYPLAAFTKLSIDTIVVRVNEPLFAIQRPVSFLRDWQKSLLKVDTINSKSFKYDRTRLCLLIQIPNDNHTIYLDRGGRHFLFDRKAYKMTVANKAVLKRYFPNNSSKVLDSELKKYAGSEYGYHKKDYLPNDWLFRH